MSTPADGSLDAVSSSKLTCIYVGHRLHPIFVALVSVTDCDRISKGRAIECNVSEHATGVDFRPTRQRNREAMVYTVTLTTPTAEDRDYWRRSGIREGIVAGTQWAVTHVTEIGTMSWMEAYSLTINAYPDTHMSLSQRRRLDPTFLEDSRQPKCQRKLF